MLDVIGGASRGCQAPGPGVVSRRKGLSQGTGNKKSAGKVRTGGNRSVLHQPGKSMQVLRGEERLGQPEDAQFCTLQPVQD